MRKIIAIILFVVVLVMSTVFALNNDQVISVNYLLNSSDLPLSLVVFWASLCGLILGILGMLFATYKYRHKLKRVQKKLANAEKEIEQLRQQNLISKDPF